MITHSGISGSPCRSGTSDGNGFGSTTTKSLIVVATTVLMGLAVTGCTTPPQQKTTLQARLDEERIPITADRHNSRVRVIPKKLSNQQRLQAHFTSCYSGKTERLQQLEGKLNMVATRRMEIPVYRRVYGSGGGEGGGGGGGGGC